MRNKPRLFLIAILVTYFGLALAYLMFHFLPWPIFILVFVVYLILSTLAYTEFYSSENEKNFAKALQFLNQNYSEVIPIHPKRLALKYHMLPAKDIKVYAKVCYWCMLNVKIVSAKGAYKISCYDWNWFFANFKEKESD